MLSKRAEIIANTLRMFTKLNKNQLLYSYSYIIILYDSNNLSFLCIRTMYIYAYSYVFVVHLYTYKAICLCMHIVTQLYGTKHIQYKNVCASKTRLPLPCCGRTIVQQ